MHRGSFRQRSAFGALRSSDGRVGAETIVRETIRWPDVEGKPRRAAVNAFGFGGTNAHLIAEMPAPPADGSPASDQRLEGVRQVAAPMRPEHRLAIIGMSGTFGAYQGLEALRAAFYEGQACLTDPPAGRFRGIAAPSGMPRGGYVGSLDIDLLRFRLPPQELKRLNPQHLLMLETADAALRDAAMPVGGRVAVVVGMGHEPIIQRLQERWEVGPRLRGSYSCRNSVVGGEHRRFGGRRRRGCILPEASDFLGYVGNLRFA